MKRTEDPVRILAGLHKTPSCQGSYCLRGHLPDGRVVEVYANQRKRQPGDPDFLLVEVVQSEENVKRSRFKGSEDP